MGVEEGFCYVSAFSSHLCVSSTPPSPLQTANPVVLDPGPALAALLDSGVTAALPHFPPAYVHVCDLQSAWVEVDGLFLADPCSSLHVIRCCRLSQAPRSRGRPCHGASLA